MSKLVDARAVSATPVYELIKRDFGVDLGIIAGDGSRDAPYVIVCESTSILVEIALEFLRYMAIGQSVYWRSLGFTLVSSPTGNVLQGRIERKRFAEDEIETTVNAIYFRMTSSEIDHDLLPDPQTYVTSNKGLKVPDELAWLHRWGKSIDYEDRAPGLGESHSYECVGAKATLYIYDKGQSLIDSNPAGGSVVSELEIATREIMQLSECVEAWGESKVLSASVFSGFVIGDEFSMLCLGAVSEAYLKFRITFPQSSDFYDLGLDSIQAFDSFAAGAAPGAGH
jgi:hypothetical protein